MKVRRRLEKGRKAQARFVMNMLFAIPLSAQPLPFFPPRDASSSQASKPHCALIFREILNRILCYSTSLRFCAREVRMLQHEGEGREDPHAGWNPEPKHNGIIRKCVKWLREGDSWSAKGLAAHLLCECWCSFFCNINTRLQTSAIKPKQFAQKNLFSSM